MSNKILGDSINFTTSENDILLSQNLIVDIGKNITFESGTKLVANSNVYFPDSTRIYIGNTTNTLAATLADGIPKGCIMIWSGTEESRPTGWSVCNGNGGVAVNGVTIPDLRGLFIIGTDPGDPAINTTYPLNQQGGNINNQVTLTTANFPTHTHTGTTSQDGDSHNHTYLAGFGSASASYMYVSEYRDGKSYATGNSTHTHSITTNSAGSGVAVSIIPPYYSLVYIIKTL